MPKRAADRRATYPGEMSHSGMEHEAIELSWVGWSITSAVATDPLRDNGVGLGPRRPRIGARQ